MGVEEFPYIDLQDPATRHPRGARCLLSNAIRIERGRTAGLSTSLVATSIFLVTLAVNLQVPLYQTYAAAADYGNGPTAVVFACYVAGLLPTLILLGGLSDRVGRKETLLAGLTLASTATVLGILAPRMQTLLGARVLQGIAVGLTVGNGTAYLAELLGGDAIRASRLVAVTTALGFGGGALLTTIALVCRSTVVPPSYSAAVAATLICIVLVAIACPALPPVGGSLVRLPHFPKGSSLPGFAIGVAWAVSGLVVAVVPAQLGQHGLAIWAGPVLFLVNCAGVMVQPSARAMAALSAIDRGLYLIPVGYVLLIAGAHLRFLPVVLAGACIAGTGCYGYTYLGGLARIAERSGAERARGVAGYFLCAYIGFGAPSVVIGFGADVVGLSRALGAFAIVVFAASGALLVAQRRASAREERVP